MEPPSEIIIECTLKHLHDSLVEILVEHFRLFSHACGCITALVEWPRTHVPSFNRR